jgi:large subunit ribosomal protein L22
MESTATLRHARVSARKARLVADVVRGQPAAQALESLQFLEKKTAPLVAKLIESAIANAEHAAERDHRALDIDNLVVKSIVVDAGQTLRRFRPRAQGRATPIHKKTAHITVILDEAKE